MRQRIALCLAFLGLLAVPLLMYGQTPVKIVLANNAPIPNDTTDHIDMNLNKTGIFTAVVTDSVGHVIANPKLIWVSGYPSVASVNLATGKITARRYGYATIYATATKNGKSITGSARACVVPSTPFYLDPRIIAKGVTVAPAKAPTQTSFSLFPHDTTQLIMNAQLFGDDTTRADIDSWGPCVHWTLNAGPATPNLPPATQLTITKRGLVTIKCCTSMFYPSATIGTVLMVSKVYWIDDRIPTQRTADAHVDRAHVAWGANRPAWLATP